MTLSRTNIHRVALSTAGIAAVGAGAITVSPAQAIPPGYKLNWSEEFNGKPGSPPNPKTWGYDLGANGWGNNELEEYVADTDHARIVTDKAATDGRALEIRATRDKDGKYRSARILSINKVSTQYGYIEARLKLPVGKGIWPAFWMMGEDIDKVSWPRCGEIDVMEYLGHEPSIAYGTLHSPGASGAQGLSASYTLPNGKKFKDDYHTFGILWEPKAITFYVDGVPYKKRTPADLPAGGEWAFDKPFFFLLNLAVGGNWPGYPDKTTVLPQSYRVDYVRVYKPAK